MSTTSVCVNIRRGAAGHFGISETGNYDGADPPITDSTEIYIELDEYAYVATTIGQARQLIAAIERGIEGIPAERAERRAREQRAAARRADREQAAAVSA